jgi:hypothetical protein
MCSGHSCRADYSHQQTASGVDKKASIAETDREIREAIESELWWNYFVDSDKISVSVNNKTATLKGTVGSWQEFITAVKNTFEAGAFAVKSYLKNRKNGAPYYLLYQHPPLWYDYLETFPLLLDPNSD